MNVSKLLILLTLCIRLISCGERHSKIQSRQIQRVKPKPSISLPYTIDQQLPHSQTAFTEGLQYYQDELFESTGSPSNLPQSVSIYGTVDSLTGEIEVHHTLDKKYFGEGICILNDRVYQLTYKRRIGFVYDLSSKKQLKTFKIPTHEGWGLTTDGEKLMMTDGSAYIHFINPTTLKKEGGIKVYNHRGAVENLNEVEYVNGFIYANVFTTNNIVKIDIETGQVVAKINLDALKAKEDGISDNALETNGIAYRSDTKQFYVTGKMWRNIYVISLME